jgi:hypothetical protein
MILPYIMEIESCFVKGSASFVAGDEFYFL